MEVKKTSVLPEIPLKITGISLIIMAVVAGVGYGHAFNSIYVPKEGKTTIAHLKEEAFLIWVAAISFAIIALLDIVISWSLYRSFQSVDKFLSRLIAFSRLVYTFILFVAVVCLFNAALLAINQELDTSSIINSLKEFLTIWSIGLIVFGVHLLLLGWLLASSRIAPRQVSGLLFLAGFCYLLVHASRALFSQQESMIAAAENILALPMAIGELLLAYWMLKVGFSQKKESKEKIIST